MKYLESMTTSELISNTTKLLGKFPNTYTYTKNLGERLLTGRKGDVPLCLVRPAIINSSYSEPLTLNSTDAFQIHDHIMTLSLSLHLNITQGSTLQVQKMEDCLSPQSTQLCILVSLLRVHRYRNRLLCRLQTCQNIRRLRRPAFRACRIAISCPDSPIVVLILLLLMILCPKCPCFFFGFHLDCPLQPFLGSIFSFEQVVFLAILSFVVFQHQPFQNFLQFTFSML